MCGILLLCVHGSLVDGHHLLPNDKLHTKVETHQIKFRPLRKLENLIEHSDNIWPIVSKQASLKCSIEDIRVPTRKTSLHTHSESHGCQKQKLHDVKMDFSYTDDQ